MPDPLNAVLNRNDFTEPKDHAYNIMLGASDVQRRNALTAVTGLKGSVIMRNALAFYYAMAVAGQPMCANGTMCLVPQMHPPTSLGHPHAAAPLSPPPVPRGTGPDIAS